LVWTLTLHALLEQYMLPSCVCVSVRLTLAGTVPKRLKIRSRKQCHTIAQDFSLLVPKISAKF